MIKAYPKQLSLLLLVTVIAFSTGCDSDEPIKNIPNNIVSIGNKPGVGEVLMNIDVNKGNVITYELFNDLNISNRFSYQMNEVTQETEFVIWNHPTYEILTYAASQDEIERSPLNINKTDYYWNHGVSSNDYVAFWGMEFDNIDDSFITIVDRETNTSKVLLACEDCYGASPIYRPMLIRDNLLFALFLTDTNPYLAVFDLSSQTKIYGVEFDNYPTIVVGDDHIYRYDGSSSTMQVFESLTFEPVGSYSLPYSLSIGLYGSTNDRVVVYQLFAQPTLISGAPQVINLNTGEVIHGFSYNDLADNRQEFSEKTGLTLSSPAGVSYLDLHKKFVLFSGVQNGENTSEYVYILSNYSGSYRDHIIMPYQPKGVIAVSWK